MGLFFLCSVIRHLSLFGVVFFFFFLNLLRFLAVSDNNNISTWFYNHLRSPEQNHGGLVCYSCIAPTWNQPLGDSSTLKSMTPLKKKNIKNKIPPPRATVSLNSTFYNLLAKCIIHIHTVQSETTQNHLLKHWYESPPLQKLLRLALFFSIYFLNRKQNNLWKKNTFF